MKICPTCAGCGKTLQFVVRERGYEPANEGETWVLESGTGWKALPCVVCDGTGEVDESLREEPQKRKSD